MTTVRHIWAALWWADGQWYVASTAHRDLEGVGATIPQALADLERIIDRLEPARRRRLWEGTIWAALPRSYVPVRVAVVEE